VYDIGAIAEGQMFDYDRNIVYVLGNNQCEYHCNIADVSGVPAKLAALVQVLENHQQHAARAMQWGRLPV
jgi:hypothetical protein